MLYIVAKTQPDETVKTVEKNGIRGSESLFRFRRFEGENFGKKSLGNVIYGFFEKFWPENGRLKFWSWGCRFRIFHFFEKTTCAVVLIVLIVLSRFHPFSFGLFRFLPFCIVSSVLLRFLCLLESLACSTIWTNTTTFLFIFSYFFRFLNQFTFFILLTWFTWHFDH